MHLTNYEYSIVHNASLAMIIIHNLIDQHKRARMYSVCEGTHKTPVISQLFFSLSTVRRLGHLFMWWEYFANQHDYHCCLTPGKSKSIAGILTHLSCNECI